MNNFHFEAPYVNTWGVQRGAELVRGRGIQNARNSPRVNGKLRFRQNPLVFQTEDHRYQGFEMNRVGDYGPLPYVNSSTQLLLGAYGPKEFDFLAFSHTTELFNEAMIDFLTKAGSFQANLLDMYRTRQQTVDMVSSTMRRFGQAYSCIRKRNFRGACGVLGITYKKPRRSSTTPADVWLEYIYGWKPLVQDVYSVLSHPFPEPYKIVKSKTCRKKEQRNGVEGSLSRGDFQLIWQSNIESSLRMRGRVRTDGAALPAASQMGLTNPLAVAWEAIPYSFVVDWFLPLGPYFESMTATAGLIFDEPLYALHQRKWSSGTYRSNYYPYIKDVQEGFTSAQATFERKEFRLDRNLFSPSWPTPRFKNPMSLTHFANAASLLASAFSRNHFDR